MDKAADGDEVIGMGSDEPVDDSAAGCRCPPQSECGVSHCFGRFPVMHVVDVDPGVTSEQPCRRHQETGVAVMMMHDIGFQVTALFSGETAECIDVFQHGGHACTAVAFTCQLMIGSVFVIASSRGIVRCDGHDMYVVSAFGQCAYLFTDLRFDTAGGVLR